MAEAQQGKVLDDLTDKVDFLVVADLNAGKTIQKKAASLNGRGAAIQVIGEDAFLALVKPTSDEFVAYLRGRSRSQYPGGDSSHNYGYRVNNNLPIIERGST